MKKTLIAVAALVATGAFAQSTVTISGVMDAGLLMTTTQNAAGTFDKANSFAGNPSSTSAINIAGSEDLGGGMKANFFVETNPDMGGASTTTAFGGGQRFVGLSGGFGDIKMGSPNTATLQVIGMSNPYGTALGGGYSASFSRIGAAGTALAVGQENRSIRSPNAIRYDSPNMSGFAFSYNMAFGNNNAAGAVVTAGVQTIGLTYSAGPLNAGFATSSIKNGGTGALATPTAAVFTGSATAVALAAGTTLSYNALSANYTFGATTVYAGYTTNKRSDNTEDGSSTNLAAKYQASGALAVSGNLVKRKDALAAAANGSLFGLGLDYSLSKRTTAYGRYEKYDTNTVFANGGERKAYAFGVRHTF